MTPTLILSIAAIIISLFSIYISWLAKSIANDLTQEDLIIKNRPYIVTTNLLKETYNGIDRVYTDRFSVVVANNPAQLIKEEFKITDSDSNEIEYINISDNKILVTNQEINYTVSFKKSENIFPLKEGVKYFRLVSIRYKSLNHKKEYNYFNKSYYNERTDSWHLIEEKSD